MLSVKLADISVGDLHELYKHISGLKGKDSVQANNLLAKQAYTFYNSVNIDEYSVELLNYFKQT